MLSASYAEAPEMVSINYVVVAATAPVAMPAYVEWPAAMATAPDAGGTAASKPAYEPHEDVAVAAWQYAEPLGHVGERIVNGYQPLAATLAPQTAPVLHFVFIIEFHAPSSLAATASSSVASHATAPAMEDEPLKLHSPPLAATYNPSTSNLPKPPSNVNYESTIRPAAIDVALAALSESRSAEPTHHATVVNSPTPARGAALDASAASLLVLGAVGGSTHTARDTSGRSVAADAVTDDGALDQWLSDSSWNVLDHGLSGFTSVAQERAAVEQVLRELHDPASSNQTPAAAAASRPADQRVDQTVVNSTPNVSNQAAPQTEAGNGGMILLPAVGDANESPILLAAAIGVLDKAPQKLNVEATIGLDQAFDVAADQAPIEIAAPAHVASEALAPQNEAASDALTAALLPRDANAPRTVETSAPPAVVPAAAAIGAVGFMGLLLRRRQDTLEDGPQLCNEAAGKESVQ